MTTDEQVVKVGLKETIVLNQIDQNSPTANKADIVTVLSPKRHREGFKTKQVLIALIG